MKMNHSKKSPKMKKMKISHFLKLMMLLLSVAAHAQSPLQHFITRDGHRLMDGKEEFRFLSINMPTLNYNEDVFDFEATQPFSLPDEFEIRDAFETYKQLGGRVVRMYTIPVRMQMEPADVPTYVEAPGLFNEEAFRTMDMVLAYANTYHIRIIFPLVNNWDAFGGKPQYAHFRNLPQDEFWTNRQLIDDFKKTINYVLNRRNTITGQLYKDDKAILCWETGNELRSPEAWTREICRYIKSTDPNHLVMDGYYAIDNQNYVQEYAMEEASIDMVSSHHYDGNPASLLKSVQKNLDIIKGRKPYIIGEIGFSSTIGTAKVFDAFIANHEISGALVWGLRNHSRNGGFYWHSEGDTRFKSYHWPGFDSGHEWDARNFIHMLRHKAHEINQLEVPPIPVPQKPEMLPISHPSLISWKGSVGASAYDVYRAYAANGPYELIGYHISDAANPYYALFSDQQAQQGQQCFYKVKAVNASGESDFSEASMPVKASNKLLIDDMEHLSNFIYSEGSIRVETADDRKYKEDMYRISGNKGSALVYYVPGALDSLRIYSFCGMKTQNLEISVSADDKHYDVVQVAPQAFYGDGKYYQVPLFYRLAMPTGKNMFYVKIKYLEPSQIGRTELYYRY